MTGSSLLSFRAKVHHGCLIIRDSQAEDDISDWDPSASIWHKSGNSIIFGVLHGSSGWVEVEVWEEPPADFLAISLFTEVLVSKFGRLVIHDPSDDIQMKFRVGRGPVRISAYVDDRDFASRVQLVVDVKY